MRDPRDKFRARRYGNFCCGIKNNLPDLDGVIAGSPLYGLAPTDNENEIKKI